MRDNTRKPSSSKTGQYALQETVTQEAENLIQVNIHELLERYSIVGFGIIVLF